MSKKKLAGIVAGLVIAIIAVVAVLAAPPASEELDSPGAPAEFVVSNLIVSPTEVEPGETVTITVDVHNVGEEQGTHELELRIDGLVEQSESLTLDGGADTSVSFLIQKEAEGSYSIEIGGLTGTFHVVAPEQPPEIVGEALVYFFDVGQADATLFLGPDFTVLIDAGDHRRNDVVPYLESVGVTGIDLLIGTHPHADHIGQFPQVLEAFPVNEVWLSGDTHTTLNFERAIDALLASDADYHEPRAGEVFQFGSLHIEVLNPYRLTGKLHEGSISVRLTFGQVSFVFTGDADINTEQATIARGYNLEAHVLQLGHHGSYTSSSRAFLEAVSPEVAIYSAGAGNRYSHPHDIVVNRIADMGIPLYGTDVHGTVVIVTDGVTYTIETEYAVSPQTGTTGVGSKG